MRLPVCATSFAYHKLEKKLKPQNTKFKSIDIDKKVEEKYLGRLVA